MSQVTYFKHEVKTKFYASGRLKSRHRYVDGKPYGPLETWYENGQPQYRDNLIDSKLHGQCEWWYENGHPMCRQNYVNGKLHGLSETWYKKDGRKSEKYYASGVEIDPAEYRARIAQLAASVAAVCHLSEKALHELIAEYSGLPWPGSSAPV